MRKSFLILILALVVCGSASAQKTNAPPAVGVVPNSAVTPATKTKITYDAKGLVTAGADATTADIADSADKRYSTDAQKTVIQNTSGANTGDETQGTIISKLTFTPENVANKDIDGTLAADSDTKYASQKATKTYVDSGLAGKASSTAVPLVGSNTAASTSITNTTAETYFNLNYQIPANTLSAGKTIRLDARGVYSALGTDSLVLKVKVCTVSGCGSGTVVILATAGAITPGALSNQGWMLNMNGVQYTAGASGTQDDQGYVAFQTAASAVTFAPMSNTAVNTIDTTVAQYLSISATWAGVGAPSASDTVTLRNLIVTVQ